jgi:hypothetical protein
MKKYSLILAIAITLALIATSCNLPFVPPIAPQGPMPGGPPQGGLPPESLPPGEQPLQGPQPEGPQPGEQPGEVQITFTADRTTLQAGQCAQLQWAVQGGFGGSLNGQPVDPSGQQQVCPNGTTTYRLEVDMGTEMLQREVTITVTGGSQQQQPTQKSSGGQTSPTKKSGSNPTPTPTKKSGGGLIQVSTVIGVKQVLDMAIINVFERSGDGEIMVTIQNSGNAVFNDNFSVTCEGFYLNGSGITIGLGPSTVGIPAQNSIKNPGGWGNFDSGLTVEASAITATATCTLDESGWTGANSANNSWGPVQIRP